MQKNILTIACIQLNSQNHLGDNLKTIETLVTQAAKKGAKLIALPENAAFMAASFSELKTNSMPDNKNNTVLNWLKMLAKKLDVWILLGSLAIKIKNNKKLANRSFLINNKGNFTASYDKIHLYDANVANGETHKESQRFIRGKTPAIAKTPWGKIGLTICYDLRFPYLYRTLAKKGAQIIFIPSAFTKFTGQAHWETLIRARAIENSCFIAAPAQTGKHPNNRETFGHSMIVDPWGNIIARKKTLPGIITATIDLGEIEKVRRQLPSLSHDVDID